MNPLKYRQIESDLSYPHILNDQLYHIHEEIIDLNSDQLLYLATNETRKLSLYQRSVCFTYGVFSAISKKKIESQVWFNKAKEGKDTIVINSKYFDRASCFTDRQKNDLYELGCRYRDGNGVPQDLLLAKKWFAKAIEKNHYGASEEWKKITTALVHNGHLEKQTKHRSLSIALDAILDLAAYHKGKGNQEDAEKWIACYKAKKFAAIQPKIAKFGGTFLKTSNNTPEIFHKFYAFKPELRENFEQQKSELLDYLQSEGVITNELPIGVNDDKIWNRLNNGICGGSVMDFISRIDMSKSSKDFDEHLSQIASRFECNANTKAISKQHIYLLASEWKLWEEWDPSVNNDPRASIIIKRHTDLIDDIVKEKLFQNLNQKVIPLQNLDERGHLRDKKYLKKWLNEEPDGKYYMHFNASGEEGHAIALIKHSGIIYLWDPNFGLIKCLGHPNYPKINQFYRSFGVSPIDKICAFISLVYGMKRNHQIEISQVVPLT